MNITILSKAMDFTEEAENYLKEIKETLSSKLASEILYKEGDDEVLETLEELIERVKAIFENLDDIEKDADDVADRAQYEKEFSQAQDNLEEAYTLLPYLSEELQYAVEKLESAPLSRDEWEEFKEINDIFSKARSSILKVKKYFEDI
jgi:DNA repair ATPase RecN